MIGIKVFPAVENLGKVRDAVIELAGKTRKILVGGLL
jgi:hypothetical protein